MQLQESREVEPKSISLYIETKPYQSYDIMDMALAERNAASSELSAAERAVAEAETILERAMQSVNNTGAEFGWNSAQCQRADRGVVAAQDLLARAKVRASNAQKNFNALNDSVLFHLPPLK